MPREVQRFAFDGVPDEVTALPGGHINQSFHVTCTGPAGPRGYLLQRLNRQVFPDGMAVMGNVAAITSYLARERSEDHVLPRQHELQLVPTRSGKLWHTDPDGSTWRAFPFLAPACTHLQASSADLSASAGLAFGTFLRMLANYDGPPLAETIAHFHDVVHSLDALERAALADPLRRMRGARSEFEQCRATGPLGEELAGVADGMPQRIVHNDAKLANVLLAVGSGEPVAVVDLDTVMPGLSLADVGDLIRSVGSPAGEEEADLARVRAEPTLIKAALTGYFTGAARVLSDAERSHAVLAGCVITLEQAMRFLHDHLMGDTYYPAPHPEQNLRRARNQLTLLKSLLDQRAALERQAVHLSREFA